MRKTQIRALIGAVFAIIVLLLFAAFATRSMGMDVPVLRDIANALGM